MCYHQVRNWNTHDSKSDKVFIIPPATFNEHIKILKDSGYTAILPDQLIAYMQKKTLLPKKPVMLTFDDGTSSQYTNALPILNKADYKATFFIMTVTIGHKAYLSSAQIKDLSDNGHVIGCHTWDHTPVTKYGPNDWNIQLTQPKQLLEKITGKPVKYFAYPYGTWNNESIIKLKANNYTAAFQLYSPGDEENSNYTIKRIIADSRWTGKQLIAEMKKNFK